MNPLANHTEAQYTPGPGAPGDPGRTFGGYVGLGERTVVTTIAIASVPFFGGLLHLLQIALDGKVARHEVGLAFAGLVLLDIAALVVAVIVAAVCFGIWLHRAVRNLARLGRFGMTYSPAGAVGSFYIPFVNFVRPHRVLTELWRASEPAAEADGSAWRAFGSSTALLDVWWGCFLASGFVSRMKPPVDFPGASGLFGLATTCLEVVAAIACYRLMRGIASRQEALSARLAALDRG
jgi:hypothetical protein